MSRSGHVFFFLTGTTTATCRIPTSSQTKRSIAVQKQFPGRPRPLRPCPVPNRDRLSAVRRAVRLIKVEGRVSWLVPVLVYMPGGGPPLGRAGWEGPSAGRGCPGLVPSGNRRQTWVVVMGASQATIATKTLASTDSEGLSTGNAFIWKLVSYAECAGHAIATRVDSNAMRLYCRGRPFSCALLSRSCCRGQNYFVHHLL